MVLRVALLGVYAGRWVWNLVHALSEVLSPAAEAFRYFMLEHAKAYPARHFSQQLEPPRPA